METAKVDIRKLQLLNDRINQCIDALNQVRLSVHGLSQGLSHTGAQSGVNAGSPYGLGQTGFGANPFLQANPFTQAGANPWFGQAGFGQMPVGQNPLTQGFGPGRYSWDKNQFGNLPNDSASSLRVATGYRVRLCDNADGTGKCEEFDKDSSQLDEGMADRASYIYVFKIPQYSKPRSRVKNP